MKPERSQHRASLAIQFPSALEADAACEALGPDNGLHATVSVEGSVLRVEASAATAMGLLRTLDDVLACVRALSPDVAVVAGQREASRHDAGVQP